MYYNDTDLKMKMVFARKYNWLFEYCELILYIGNVRQYLYYIILYICLFDTIIV